LNEKYVKATKKFISYPVVIFFILFQRTVTYITMAYLYK